MKPGGWPTCTVPGSYDGDSAYGWDRSLCHVFVLGQVEGRQYNNREGVAYYPNPTSGRQAAPNRHPVQVFLEFPRAASSSAGGGDVARAGESAPLPKDPRPQPIDRFHRRVANYIDPVLHEQEHMRLVKDRTRDVQRVAQDHFANMRPLQAIHQLITLIALTAPYRHLFAEYDLLLGCPQHP